LLGFASLGLALTARLASEAMRGLTVSGAKADMAQKGRLDVPRASGAQRARGARYGGAVDAREDPMSAEDEVKGLLAGASKTVGAARSSWLVTSTGEGGVDARPMGRLQPEAGDDAWLIRFITDARSHKAAEIKRAARVAVIFEVPADDAYVTAIGRAEVKDSAADVRRLWKPAYDAFFPTATDKANAIFLEIAAERLELWIRGVTPEPFAASTTVLERGSAGAWRVVAGPDGG
jgi:general stress protein 26